MDDFIGKKFNNLTILKEVDKTYGRMVLCLCDCGNEKVIALSSVKGGCTKTCGCLQKEMTSKAKKKAHGMCGSRLENIYYMMRDRCTNPKNADYENYGGRGISFSPEWTTFDLFLENLPDGYAENLTLNRLDPNENYSRDNCNWADSKEQGRCKTRYKSNKTGVTGVILREGKWPTYIAIWKELCGVQRSKSFGIRRCGGEEIALRLACEYRNKMIEKLNSQGAGYSDNHGCDKVFR